MEMYFLKSAACLAVLLLFYKLLLERENMHVFKRFYLLASVIASIVIPLITFTTYVEPSSEIFKQVWISSEPTAETVAVNYLPYILLGIYIMGAIFFGIKFIRNLRNLILKIKRNEKIREKNITNVLLSDMTPPHTFFHYIFFNKNEFLQKCIPQDVKVHEEAHARQMHSIDVIFIELLQIIFWINPLIFILKNAIKLNHEFLADRAVIKQGYGTATYQQTLLSYSSGDLQSNLVNPINYSSIKKRFTVMKTQTSKTVIWARGLLFLPLLALLLYGFSTKEIVEKEVENSNSTIENSETIELRMDAEGKIFQKNTLVSLEKVKNLDWKNYTSYAISISPDAPKMVEKEFVTLVVNQGIGGIISVCTQNESNSTVSQKKATPEMVAEYNKLAKHYNTMPKDGTFIKKKDSERMKYIYGLMTAEQKKSAEVYPVASPPPPPNKIMVAEYNRLVKYYNEMPEDKRMVKQKDLQRIMYILSIMSPEQKENAEKIKFKFPPPPPPAPAPSPVKGELPAPPAPPVEVIGYPAPPTPPVPPARTIDSMPPLPPNVEVNGSPIPPPPPPPPTYEDLVEKGATFYHNDKLITPEEALRLVRVEESVNIEIIDIDKKPIVKLRDKE